MNYLASNLNGNAVEEVRLYLVNGVHVHLDGWAFNNRLMVTWHGEDQGIRTVPLEKVPLDKGYLLDHIVKETTTHLSDRGLHLTISESDRYTSSLSNAYQLLSCASYYKLVNRNGKCEQGLVTKSADIVHSLAGLLTPSERRKSASRFADEFRVSRTELESGVFKVVKLEFRDGHYHLKAIRLNTKNKGVLTPYYQLLNGADLFAEQFLKGEFRVTYRDDTGREIEVLTSLHPDVLARWSHVGYQNYNRLRADWWQTIREGFVRVPDLQRSHNFINLPLLGVVKVETRSR